MDDEAKLQATSQLQDKILNEYPRLKEDDSFSFACHPGVSCFTDCCADINIVLTPYDILRMKNFLNITSREFMDKYTVTIGTKDIQLPIVMLKLKDDDKKACQFLSDKGCGIYNDRPWPCRMYPIGYASPSDSSTKIDEPFYFLMQEDVCQGFTESGGKTWTIKQWMDDQGIDEYNEMGELWKEISFHRFFQQNEDGLPPEKLDMLFLATHDLDKFKRFIFESSFLRKFDMDPDLVERIKEDDVELLKFGFQWVKFSCFKEPLFNVQADVAETLQKGGTIKK